MIRIIAYAVATVVATLALGTISDRLMTFDSASSVLVFGLVVGVINSFIKPIVSLLTLPLTCLTFGLFAFVVNAAMFKLGAEVAPGMVVSWWGAFAGSILTSLAAGVIYSVLDE